MGSPRLEAAGAAAGTGAGGDAAEAGAEVAVIMPPAIGDDDPNRLEAPCSAALCTAAFCSGVADRYADVATDWALAEWRGCHEAKTLVRSG